MAKKDTLTHLQLHLNKQLKDAQADGPVANWLAVIAGQGHYLLPLKQTAGVFPFKTIQILPYTQPWFLGVVSLHGIITGVIDWARYVQNDTPVDSPLPVIATTNEKSRLILLSDAFQVSCGLLVSDLAGLRATTAFKTHTAKSAGTPAYFGDVYVDEQGQAWQEVNLETLSQQVAFWNIAQRKL